MKDLIYVMGVPTTGGGLDYYYSFKHDVVIEIGVADDEDELKSNVIQLTDCGIYSNDELWKKVHQIKEGD